MAKRILTSPRGTAVYPRLTTPDTKFNPGGVYSTKLNVPAAEASALVAQIDAAMNAAAAEAQKTSKKKVRLADAPYTVEENGTVTFSFKLNATGKKKTGETYTQRPALFDAQNTPIVGVQRIGGGSTLRIGFEMAQFYVPAVGAGVSLRLRAAQIIKLVEWGGNAEYFGFEAEGGEGSDTIAVEEETLGASSVTQADGAAEDF